jgi:chemotaxis methyl-accepting protein methylase
MDDESFRQILEFLNLSWRGYRRVRKGVKKRLARHMQERGYRGVGDLLLAMREDEEAMREVQKLLTVSISRFFRDLRLWEVLDSRIIPKLRAKSTGVESPSVRVWSAGCSCGEEVYSLKILWDQAKRGFSSIPDLEVWATDTNPEVLEKARIGIYPQSSLKNVAPAVLARYFTSTSNGFAISEELKAGIHWLKRDFASTSPPGDGFDLIFLRNNLLTYYEPPIKIPAFVRILDALAPEGFLIIGNNEEIPIEEAPLRVCIEYGSIFTKIRKAVEDQ